MAARQELRTRLGKESCSPAQELAESQSFGHTPLPARPRLTLEMLRCVLEEMKVRFL